MTMNIEKMVIKEIVENMAKSKLSMLNKLVSNAKFVDAYNVLHGFNLTTDPIMCKDELIGLQTFFECEYHGVVATIFQTSNGGCEVHEICDVRIPLDEETICTINGVCVPIE